MSIHTERAISHIEDASVRVPRNPLFRRSGVMFREQKEPGQLEKDIRFWTAGYRAILTANNVLETLGSSIIDFDVVRQCVSPGVLAQASEVEIEELMMKADLLPGKRARKAARLMLDGTRIWMEIVNNVYHGESSDFFPTVARFLGYPEGAEIQPIPNDAIEAVVQKMRSAFKEAFGVDLGVNTRKLVHRLEGMRIFPNGAWDAIDTLTEGMRNIPDLTFDDSSDPRRKRIEKHPLFQILMAGKDRSERKMRERQMRVLEAMNERFQLGIGVVPVGITEAFQNDYWTCRTKHTGGGFELKLNLRNLFFTNLGRMGLLGGHELACHFGEVVARMDRWERLTNGEEVSSYDDGDMNLLDLVMLLPTGTQVGHEGLAETWPFLLEFEDRLSGEEKFALYESLARHWLFLNAQLQIEKIGSNPEARDKVKTAQAKYIRDKLKIAESEAKEELDFRDPFFPEYTTPQDCIRAERARYYRPSYAIGSFLLWTINERLATLNPQDAYEIRNRLGYFQMTRNTGALIILDEAYRLAPEVIDPKSIQQLLFLPKK